MYIEEFYFNNWILIESFFLLAILILCYMIFSKTIKVYVFSSYKPIKYLSLSVILYGLGFFFRFFRLFVENTSYLTNTIQPLYILFAFSEQFLTSLAGFYILYALIRRKITKEENHIIINTIAILFFFLLSLASIITKNRLINFIPLITIFISAVSITYKNKIKNKNNNISSLFFVVVLLNLIGWIGHTLAWIFLVSNNDYLYAQVFIIMDILTFGMFVIFRYITYKNLKKF